MKVAIVWCLLLATFAATWLPAVEGCWLWARCHRTVIVGKKRALPLAKIPGCPFTCKRYCPKVSCFVVCANECALKDKGDEHLKPFPHEFKSYDHDKDGFITVPEFAKTLYADQESSAAALKITDNNGDGKLSKNEFNAAPYHKEDPDGKPKPAKYTTK